MLAINAKYVHSALAVWLLSGGIKRYAHVPHNVEIIEATIHQSCEEIAGMIAAHKPDAVGISTYIWNASKVPDILKLLREQLPNAVFILGGPEASHNPDYWLAHGGDYVIKGEGERKLPALLDVLAEGRGQKTEGREQRAEGRENRDDGRFDSLDDPIDPYDETYFATMKGKLAYLETSRGCPFRCSFCLSGDDDVRFFPLETAREQIYKLSKSGVKTIKFVDRTFNCNPKRAYQLFEYVISLDTACCFHFEVAADLFDKPTLDMLRTAPPGRIQFEAGLQSYHEPTLGAVSRKMDIIKAEENICSLIQGQNIHIHIDLIAGLPYETLADFKNSFDSAYKLVAHNLQLGFLKMLHGSALRKQAGELGIEYNKAPPYEIKCSPWLSADDIRILKQTENALRHTYNKSRFLSALEYVLLASGIRPFDLFYMLGSRFENHGLSLEIYAQHVYDCFCEIPMVDESEMLECMICDWLAMVRGKNMPVFMRRPDSRRKLVVSAVEKILGRHIGREEVALLPSGGWVYVDVEKCSFVTGLYEIGFKN